ncbi:unnamed protein product [Gadus morhua 'NCC']
MARSPGARVGIEPRSLRGILPTRLALADGAMEGCTAAIPLHSHDDSEHAGAAQLIFAERRTAVWLQGMSARPRAWAGKPGRLVGGGSGVCPTSSLCVCL